MPWIFTAAKAVLADTAAGNVPVFKQMKGKPEIQKAYALGNSIQ